MRKVLLFLFPLIIIVSTHQGIQALQRGFKEIPSLEEQAAQKFADDVPYEYAREKTIPGSVKDVIGEHADLGERLVAAILKCEGNQVNYQEFENNIRHLLRRGADVNYRSSESGMTPLHAALTYKVLLKCNGVELADMLVTYDARPDIPDRQGQTVMQKLAQFKRDGVLQGLGLGAEPGFMFDFYMDDFPPEMPWSDKLERLYKRLLRKGYGQE